MRAFVVAIATTALLAGSAGAQLPNPEPADCFAAGPCNEAEGNPASANFASLSAAEVDRVVRTAAAAVNRNDLTVAVVDRAGRPLAVWRGANANPANDDLSVGSART